MPTRIIKTKQEERVVVEITHEEFKKLTAGLVPATPEEVAKQVQAILECRDHITHNKNTPESERRLAYMETIDQIRDYLNLVDMVFQISHLFTSRQGFSRIEDDDIFGATTDQVKE